MNTQQLITITDIHHASVSTLLAGVAVSVLNLMAKCKPVVRVAWHARRRRGRWLG